MKKKLPINWNEAKELFEAHSSVKDVASYFGMTDDNLRIRYEAEHSGNSFTEWKNNCKQRGKVILRKAQYDKAVKDGNVQLLIHLGKHYLGQSDKAEIEVDSKVSGFSISFEDMSSKELREIVNSNS